MGIARIGQLHIFKISEYEYCADWADERRPHTYTRVSTSFVPCSHHPDSTIQVDVEEDLEGGGRERRGAGEGAKY